MTAHIPGGDQCDCPAIWVGAIRLFVDDDLDGAERLLQGASTICLATQGIRFAGATILDMNQWRPGCGDALLRALGLSIARAKQA
jgi:hypothetical protein